MVRLQVRHEKKELLEKVTETVMVATFKLVTPIPLDTYASYKSAITGAKKCSTLQNCVRPIYIAPLVNEKYVTGDTSVVGRKV